MISARSLRARNGSRSSVDIMLVGADALVVFRERVTVCSGALVAARAGLLDGRECTTHHTLCKKLEQLAPRAKVLENRLYVSDGNISTSAGITAGIDMTLRFIAEVASPKVASAVARDMVVYMRRTGSGTGTRNADHP